MRRIALVLLAACMAGCEGSDPVTALGSCQVELDRIGIPAENLVRQTDFLENCMESKGFDYQSEKDECHGIRFNRFGFRGSCYEQRGMVRTVKLQWLKATSKN